MARDRAGIDVIAAADRGRDDETELLAPIEIGNVVGTGAGIEQQREDECSEAQGKHDGLHRPKLATATTVNDKDAVCFTQDEPHTPFIPGKRGSRVSGLAWQRFIGSPLSRGANGLSQWRM